MSILQEYEEIRAELGENKWQAIDKYLEFNNEVLLSDVLYNENQYKAFEKWNKETITQDVFKQVDKVLQLEDKEDFKIEYILVNLEEPTTSFAILSADDDICKINLNEEESIDIAEWDFNYDGYFLEDLSSNEIGYISDECNYGLWCTIDEWYPSNLSEKENMQKYLQYCIDNGITKESIDDKLNLDTPNIMQYKLEEKVHYENNKVLLMTGVRNEDTKIALVMVDGKERIKDEFIIAFNYEIKDKEISWGYGKYYGDDFASAKTDVEKAISGESLADSFSNKSKTNEKKERSEYGI